MIRKTRSSNREDINQDSPMELDVEVSSDEDASVSSSTVADPSEEHEDEPETPTPNTHRDHLMLDGRHCLNLLYSIKPGSKLLELMVFQRTLNEAPIQEHYTLLDVVDTITQHINMNNLRTPDNQSMVKCSTLMKDAFDQDYQGDADTTAIEKIEEIQLVPYEIVDFGPNDNGLLNIYINIKQNTTPFTVLGKILSTK